MSTRKCYAESTKHLQSSVLHLTRNTNCALYRIINFLIALKKTKPFMGKVKKAAATSSLGRSLVKDKSKRDRNKNKKDGWVINILLLSACYSNIYYNSCIPVNYQTVMNGEDSTYNQ